MSDQYTEQPKPEQEQPKQTAWAQLNAKGDARQLDGRSISLRRDPVQGRYVFGVLVDGAFISFADRKLGGVDDDLKEAALPGFKGERAAQYREEQGL